MPIGSIALDRIYAYQIFRMIVSDWKDTEAFKLGIIDENGKAIKKSSQLKTREEKLAWTPLKRLAYNIKRFINRLGGKGKISSIATAMWLLREESKKHNSLGEYEKFEVELFEHLISAGWKYDVSLAEEFLNEEVLLEGNYYLNNDEIEITENVTPVGHVYGFDIYELVFEDRQYYVLRSDLLEKVKPAREEDVDPQELKWGIKVEMEHTDDPDEAKNIALEHLRENPKYYSLLKKSGLADELDETFMEETAENISFDVEKYVTKNFEDDDFDDEEEVKTFAHEILAKYIKKVAKPEYGKTNLLDVDVDLEEIEKAGIAFEQQDQTHERRIGFIETMLKKRIDNSVKGGMSIEEFQMIIEEVCGNCVGASGSTDASTGGVAGIGTNPPVKKKKKAMPKVLRRRKSYSEFMEKE